MTVQQRVLGMVRKKLVEIKRKGKVRKNQRRKRRKKFKESRIEE